MVGIQLSQYKIKSARKKVQKKRYVARCIIHQYHHLSWIKTKENVQQYLSQKESNINFTIIQIEYDYQVIINIIAIT